jgi:hypothetical protein
MSRRTLLGSDRAAELPFRPPIAFPGVERTQRHGPQSALSNVLNLIFGELRPGVGTKINVLALLGTLQREGDDRELTLRVLWSWTMPGFFKAAAIVMSGGAIVGTGVLATLPNELQSPPLTVAGQIADLPTLPCEQQLWLNADRTCQSWTVPHRDVKRILSPESTPDEPAPEPVAAPATSTRLTADESAAKARARASRTAEVRAGAARIARGENVSRRMRVASRAANGTQSGFFFWPTSQQDANHQRSPRRSADMTRMFAFFGSPTR